MSIKYCNKLVAKCFELAHIVTGKEWAVVQLVNCTMQHIKGKKEKKSCTPWLKIITTKILDSSLPLCVEDFKKEKKKQGEKKKKKKKKKNQMKKIAWKCPSNVCCAAAPPPPPPPTPKKKKPTSNYLDLVDILPPSPWTPLNQRFLFHWSAIFNTVKKKSMCPWIQAIYRNNLKAREFQ